MDGSQKLPQRILNTIRDRYSMGLQSPGLTTVVAAWMRWQFAVDETGAAYEVQDPLAEETKRLVAKAGSNPQEIARSLISIEEVFGADLSTNPNFVQATGNALANLLNKGSAATVATFEIHTQAAD